MCGSCIGLWKVVIIFPHRLWLTRDDWPEGRVCVMSHQQQLQAFRCTQCSRQCMETWIHFRVPDFFHLGPWMLAYACQHISLVDPAINK